MGRVPERDQQNQDCAKGHCVIQVNCVIPGGVLSKQNKKFIESYSKLTPMKRMMKKTELNELIDYLCSEKSSYVTGSSFTVDGGYTTW